MLPIINVSQKKHILKSLTIVCLSLLLISSIALPAAATGTIAIDYRTLTGVSPVIISGTTYVPMRAIFEAMGASISWDAASQSVTATKGGKVVKITLNSPTAYINGAATPMKTPAKRIGSNVMVPARFVGESLGASVGYNSQTKFVSILTQAAKAPMDWETGWVTPLNNISDRQNAISAKFPNVTQADVATLDQITADLEKLKGNIPALQPLNPDDGYALIDSEKQWTDAVHQAVTAVLANDISTANTFISKSNDIRTQEKTHLEMIPSVY